MRVLAIWFGVGLSTTQRTIHHLIDVVGALPMPGYDAACQLGRFSERKYGPEFADCIGAIDGSPIPLRKNASSLPPGVNPDVYYSAYYGCFGLKLLAVISLHGLVLLYDIRPLAVHDSGVLTDRSEYFRTPSGKVLLGDVAFGGFDWIIVPARDGEASRSAEARAWNRFLCPVRVRVEHGFGAIKGTFRILHGPLSVSVALAARLLGAIIRMHNLFRCPYVRAMTKLVLNELPVLPYELDC